MKLNLFISLVFVLALLAHEPGQCQETSQEYGAALNYFVQVQDDLPRYELSTDLPVLALPRYSQEAGDANQFWLQAAGTKPAPYLIGVHCESAGETKFMSNEVGGLITVKGGLRINKISKDSPAEKIGMQVEDIILFVDDRMVTSIDDLAAVVTEKGETEVHGALIRDEKIVEFDVTPVKRPIENKENESGTDELRFGKSWVWVVPNKAALPKGYSVIIELENGARPSFVFKNDENTWESKTGSDSKLPDDVQPFTRAAVESLLPLVQDKQSNYISVSDNYFKALLNSNLNRWTLDDNSHQLPPGKTLSKQIDELQKQIGELTKAVNELKKQND